MSNVEMYIFFWGVVYVYKKLNYKNKPNQKSNINVQILSLH